MKACIPAAVAFAVLSFGAALAHADGGKSAAAGASASHPTVKTASSSEYGAYLSDARGRALYLFEADKQGEGDAKAQSNCYGDCAKAWPPLVAEGKPRAQGKADESLLGTTERKGGAEQLTYNGWPLYYFVKDKGPGETNGQGVNGYGGEWYLVRPDGEKLEQAK